MRALTFYTPESMVNSLRDVKVKNLILESSKNVAVILPLTEELPQTSNHSK